ncbi:transposase [Cytobacillus sp. Hm23]
MRSIPEIEGKIAATIISEIEEIERYNNPKKPVAFAEIDPSAHESDLFTNYLTVLLPILRLSCHFL